jgi:hypothetical protein
MHIARIIASACYTFILLIGSAIAQTDLFDQNDPYAHFDTPWLAIETKCPADNASIYEEVRRNVLGETMKNTATYRDNSMITLFHIIKRPGLDDSTWVFDFIANKRIDGGTGPDTVTLSNFMRIAVDKGMRHYCLSEGEERIAAREEIAGNRRKFGIR